MRKYSLKNPSNARVFIDFTSKTKPVSFEYPNKKPAFVLVFNAFIAILSLIIIGLFLLNIPNIIYFLFFHESTESISSNGLEASVGLPILSTNILFLLLALFFLFYVGVPFILAGLLSDNKRFLEKMPYINMWIAKFKFSSVCRSEVRKLKTTEYEIPIFDNVFLQYKATREFSRYLWKIEVTEHDFYYSHYNLFTGKFKKQKNDGLWKVKFIFSRIPEKGKLVVEYI